VKILVIDDAPEIIEVVSICLQLRWSHASVISAGTGYRGLEVLAAEKPELVLLDVNLPDIDGFQVLQKIRETSQVPVVMLTVKSKDTDIARGLEMGADDYIVKPFSNIEFIARLEAVMRRAKQDN
jgi:DNA-binding response OmpR family regulator